MNTPCQMCRGVGSHGEPPTPCAWCKVNALPALAASDAPAVTQEMISAAAPYCAGGSRDMAHAALDAALRARLGRWPWQESKKPESAPPADALDAARYRWLRVGAEMCFHFDHIDGRHRITIEFPWADPHSLDECDPGECLAAFDAAIDIARGIASGETFAPAYNVDVMAASLYEHIKHGDDEHRAWLRNAAIEWASAWCAKDHPNPKGGVSGGAK